MKQDDARGSMQRFVDWLANKKYRYVDKDGKEHYGAGTLREIRFFEYCNSEEVMDQVIEDLVSFEPFIRENNKDRLHPLVKAKMIGAHRMLSLITRFLPVKKVDISKYKPRLTGNDKYKLGLNGKIYIFGTMEDVKERGIEFI